MTSSASVAAGPGAGPADNRTKRPAGIPGRPAAAAWLLILLVMLSGCAGRSSGGAANNPTPGLNVANNSWFCQVAESGEGWDCVEDEDLVRSPRPTRLPDSPPPAGRDAAGADRATVAGAAAPTLATPPVDGPSPAAAAPVPDPAPAAQTAERAPVTEDELPTHVRLAYQPPQPTLLDDLPGEFFTVQLLAMSSKETLEAYVRDHGLKGLSAARIENDGDLFYVLLLGVYETEALARQAMSDLPPPLDETRPWVRPLGSLQQAMRRADELAGSQRI